MGFVIVPNMELCKTNNKETTDNGDEVLLMVEMTIPEVSHIVSPRHRLQKMYSEQASDTVIQL